MTEYPVPLLLLNYNSVIPGTRSATRNPEFLYWTPYHVWGDMLLYLAVDA